MPGQLPRIRKKIESTLESNLHTKYKGTSTSRQNAKIKISLQDAPEGLQHKKKDQKL
jgi:hypothetical protein